MFTEQELKIFMKLIDQGIRAEGLAAVEVLYPLAAKCSGLLQASAGPAEKAE